MLAGTPQGLLEQDVPVLHDLLVEQAAFCFEGQVPQSLVEAQEARRAVAVTRRSVCSVFMIFGLVGFVRGKVLIFQPSGQQRFAARE
jgi:hypothetical protein